MARVAAAWAADAGGLGRLARSRGVALVHTNTSVTLGGAAAARVAGVPHVWHVREIYAGFERWWPAYRRLLLTADALPCVSRADLRAVRRRARGARAARRPRRRSPGARRARQARAALGLAGRRVRRRGARAHLGLEGPGRARPRARRAAAARPRRRVALVAGAPWRGEERHRRELHALAARLGVADRAPRRRLPRRRRDVYGAADVVVVPSKQPDPLPNAALEAAAAGCCVVAAAHGGLPEIVRDGETGRLVAPGDPRALAAALAELADDPAQRERLGAAAAADVGARFARRAAARRDPGALRPPARLGLTTAAGRRAARGGSNPTPTCGSRAARAEPPPAARRPGRRARRPRPRPAAWPPGR